MNVLSAPQMARRYEIPLRTIQAACKTGTLLAQKFGRVWMIEDQEAAKFAANHRKVQRLRLS